MQVFGSAQHDLLRTDAAAEQDRSVAKSPCDAQRNTISHKVWVKDMICPIKIRNFFIEREDRAVFFIHAGGPNPQGSQSFGTFRHRAGFATTNEVRTSVARHTERVRWNLRSVIRSGATRPSLYGRRNEKRVPDNRAPSVRIVPGKVISCRTLPSSGWKPGNCRD